MTELKQRVEVPGEGRQGMSLSWGNSQRVGRTMQRERSRQYLPEIRSQARESF